LKDGKLIYEIEFKPQALKDLRAIDKGEARRIIEKIKVMENDLAGDVKRLTNFTPEYRLRVGNYRVLFEVEGGKVVIYRVRHRRDAYS
jgi:mRNA interferase RelE/StbE